MTTPDHYPPAEEPNRDGKPERFNATDFESSRILRDKLLGLGREKPLPDDPPTTKQKQEAAKRVGDGEFALSLVEDDLVPFQSEGEAYAVFSDKGASRIIALRSREFGALIRRRFFAETSRLLGKAAFGAALQALIDKALEGEERALHLRTAPIPDGICLDLGGRMRRAVTITPGGFEVTAAPPALFRSSSGALVEPAAAGDLGLLRRHLNVSDVQFQLIVAWLTFSMRPAGPYPLLALSGEQGSAKTTAAAVLRYLLDGRRTGGRALPASKQNLDVSARLSHLLSYDNVSYISPAMSDCLARLATGEEEGRRRLFTDSDEVVFEAMRPILINGIGSVVTRPDLVDRTIFIEVPVIPKSRRLTKKAFWQRFEQDAPAIMTGLVEVIVQGLRRLPDTVLADLPRMADFAEWGCAIERTHWSEGSFMEAYGANIEAGNADILQVDDLGMAIVEMMSETSSWTGTATQLLERLDGDRTKQQRRLQPLPPNGQRLSIELQRLAPVLRRRGIEIEHRLAPDKHRTRLITLSVDAGCVEEE
ncbi:hypothetical protein [Bosea sp. TND4EK4]|uniref:hypothetical protein n=1 Tax=Bosea sp. TND4EK4 TaxID=1907408 RepID=UPI0009548CFA|nr:hypothetical protein [Bosea sp. TND4EK4]SIR61364.1 hypothetical protein SAMN05880592_1402 [Bosea sp. TND4EK4]